METSSRLITKEYIDVCNKRLKPTLTDVMIDIETCSTNVNALICSIGIVEFNLFEDPSLRKSTIILLDKADCEKYNLDINEATMKWWSSQPQEVRFEAFDKQPRVSLKEGLEQLNKICLYKKRFWCQGMNFDPVILESSYKACGIKPAWRFWEWRDSRTIQKLSSTIPKRKNAAHSAIDDANAQVDGLFHVFQEYNIKFA